VLLLSSLVWTWRTTSGQSLISFESRRRLPSSSHMSSCCVAMTEPLVLATTPCRMQSSTTACFTKCRCWRLSTWLWKPRLSSTWNFPLLPARRGCFYSGQCTTSQRSLITHPAKCWSWSLMSQNKLLCLWTFSVRCSTIVAFIVCYCIFMCFSICAFIILSLDFIGWMLNVKMMHIISNDVWIWR